LTGFTLWCKVNFMKAPSQESIGSCQLRSFTGNVVARGCLSAVIVSALGLMLTGCANVAQGAEFHPGSYSGTRLRGDKIRIRFDQNGKFILTDKECKTLVEGRYKVAKDEITFTDEKGPIASKDAKPGEYKWKLENKILNFTKIEDESAGRSNGITGTTWKLGE
jgi:hypothetical protein